jgi:hypothetical protein
LLLSLLQAPIVAGVDTTTMLKDIVELAGLGHAASTVVDIITTLASGTVHDRSDFSPDCQAQRSRGRSLSALFLTSIGEHSIDRIDELPHRRHHDAEYSGVLQFFSRCR